MNPKILFIICCDVEEDDPDVGGTPYNQRNTLLVWNGITKGVPIIEKITESVKDTDSNYAKISWFIRCDEQIQKLHGDYAWALKEFRDIWDRLEQRGDELAWHPHFWRWSKKYGTWSQEIEDKKWMLGCLKVGYDNFVKHTGRVYSVRTGWGYQNNETMKILADLGIRADLSAMPGLKSLGVMKYGSFSMNYDWRVTLDKPYYPSQNDYRIPTKKGLSLPILEIPTLIVFRSFSRMLHAIVEYRSLSFPIMKRPLSPLIKPRKFKQIIRNCIKNAKHEKEPVHIAMYFHISDAHRPNAISNLKANLHTIERLSKEENVPCYFLTAKEAGERLGKIYG